VSETLKISRLGHRGDGIVDTPSGPRYVPYTLPGETVTVDDIAGHPDRAHLLTVDTASAERIEPICPHFGVCGGCALQHWALARQRDWKRQLVIDALAQAAIDAQTGVTVGATVDAYGDGRRRVTLHARRSTHDVIEVGYAALRAHQIIPIDRCPILSPAMAGTIDTAWDIASALKLAQKPLDIQVTASETGLDIDVRGSGPLDPATSASLASIVARRRLARLTRQGELIAQNAPPHITVGRAKVLIPPGAFLQATTEGEATLARLVLEHVGKARRIADLFSGIGPFALRLAENARVAAVDNDAAAITALQKAFKSTTGLKPVDAQVRDLFRQPLVKQELKEFDAVVFDPPRQGAEAQAREFAASAVPVIVSVSCDEASFARDACILIAGGYRLAAVTPVDQFRYSPHVEIVAKFEK
jgi:23S rRNA (uracil1939-C5)-methyltransferase